MHVSAEAQLILLIAALYLYDCVSLVYRNEVIVHRVGKGRRVLFPRESATFGRRLMLILPLAFPFLTAYRFSWNASVNGDAILTEDSYSRFRKVDKVLSAALAPMTVFIVVGVFVAIPFGLRFLTTMSFLVLLALLYVGIFYQLVRLWRVRVVCQLSTEKFWALAFECVACPPCAANLLRKVSLLTTPGLDLIDYVEKALPNEQQKHVVGVVLKRVDDDLMTEEPESVHAQLLRDYRSHLRIRFQLESDTTNKVIASVQEGDQDPSCPREERIGEVDEVCESRLPSSHEYVPGSRAIVETQPIVAEPTGLNPVESWVAAPPSRPEKAEDQSAKEPSSRPDEENLLSDVEARR